MVKTRSRTSTASPKKLIPKDKIDMNETGELNTNTAFRDNIEQEILKQ
jgi:hypothetical protein